MTSELSGPWWIGILSILNVIWGIAIVVACIYGFILLVKLAHLGIKALRIYIEKNKN